MPGSERKQVEPSKRDAPSPVFAAQHGAAAEIVAPAILLQSLLPRLWRFALRLTRDRHDAEDLVRRACACALKREEQLQRGNAALNKMFSILHSVWLNDMRAHRIRGRTKLPWIEGPESTLEGSAALDPKLNRLHRRVIEAVGALPDAQRALLLLVAVEGLSYREAAEALDIPIATAMSRLARARLTIGESFGTGVAPLS